MISLSLVRDTISDDGVFGILTLRGGVEQQTVEDDWLDNAPGKSCIPAGRYILRRTIFHKHGYETFEVTGVPGRSRILIHVANTEEDVEGCIGVGLHRGKIRVAKDEDTGETDRLKDGVTSSQNAFDYFMHTMAGFDEAELVVTWAPGLLQ